MKKVQVLSAHQKGKEFYLLSYDPREIIKIVKIPPKNTSQESQRPWLEKRVKEIAKYAAGLTNISEDTANKIKAKGIIPNCPILSISSPLQIVKENGNTFIMLPESENEIHQCYGKINILDGQHRLISFSDEYLEVSFKNSELYQMGFVVFQGLTTSEMREIFMITNDKQEKMEQNVLRQIKKWLGLLSEEEDNIYNLIEKLNSESISPLKSKIIVGGNKLSNGFKLTQVSKIFKTSKLYELLKNSPIDNQIKIISYYLQAWESVYSGMFNNPKHTMGKITGLRYACFLFPYIFEILKEKRLGLVSENIKPLLQELYNMTGGVTIFDDQNIKLAFRAESATIALAKTHGSMVKDYILNQSEVFDPTNI